MLRNLVLLALVLVAAQARLPSFRRNLSSQNKASLTDLMNALRQEEECGGRGDIVFVVDSSGSIGGSNFGKVKSFMKDIVNSFTIGPDDVQIGVVEFSQGSHIEFNLNTHGTADGVNKAIDAMPYLGSTTNTNSALKLMMGTAFTAAGGDRDSAPNIGIVITDGKSDSDVTANANAAKAMGITMFAVGVGGYDKSELDAIANDPSEEYVFTVNNFDGLDEITAALAEKACAATNPCRGAGEYENVAGMPEWCETNCLACYCPSTHCVCEGLETDCPEKRRSETRSLLRFLF